MGSTRTYWFYQVIGWSLYFFSDLLNYYALITFNFEEISRLIGNGMVNIAAGISLTHIFRYIFKKNNWIKLPVGPLIFRSVLVIGIISLLLAAINIPMDDSFLSFEKMNWIIRDLSYWFNLAKPVTLWLVIYVMYSFASEHQNSQIEKVKLEASVKESEAKILRAQMNPHFVFNALNGIRALISEDPSKAQSAITNLSNLLRSALVSERKTTITLKEELKTIEDYLSLEKIRYEERLQIKWEISPESLKVQVPPMMLQTLVENAIKHGVQKAVRWGFVEVKTHIVNDLLKISIRNTGKLLDKKQIKQHGGFGLENTRKRIKLLYGEKGNFEIFQDDPLTVKALIEIPLDTQVNESNYSR